MQLESERHLRVDREPLSILVGSEVWDLYVFGVTKVARDWWVQIAVVGPRSCTVTVRVAAANGRDAAAHEIITLITRWLAEDDTSEHVFLEDRNLEARAS